MPKTIYEKDPLLALAAASERHPNEADPYKPKSYENHKPADHYAELWGIPYLEASHRLQKLAREKMASVINLHWKHPVSQQRHSHAYYLLHESPLPRKTRTSVIVD